ncbi:MAG: endonuclease III [Alphaproteobacteria bacterium]|nr:endonuclease III [Alphaproteobacteria bacterium]
MKPADVDEFFRRLAAIEPEPKTELNYVNAYTLLGAVVLSAQATDAGVNKATAGLFKKVQTPDAMLKLGEAGLKEYVKTIGLFNGKAKNIIALSRILVERFKGEVPGTRGELESLPGVGRKTANVILNVYFGQPTMAVDTHVFRVANRTGMAKGETPEAVEAKLVKVIPAKYMGHAHHWLILHGRYVCKARGPECPACVVRDLCAFRDKTKVKDAPSPGKTKS